MEKMIEKFIRASSDQALAVIREEYNRLVVANGGDWVDANDDDFSSQLFPNWSRCGNSFSVAKYVEEEFWCQNQSFCYAARELVGAGKILPEMGNFSEQRLNALLGQYGCQRISEWLVRPASSSNVAA